MTEAEREEWFRHPPTSDTVVAGRHEADARNVGLVAQERTVRIGCADVQLGWFADIDRVSRLMFVYAARPPVAGEAIMQIAVLTFEGFNELDSFVAAAILNRMKGKGWKAHITSPAEQVTSMNGVTVQRQQPLEFAAEADAVLIGSGILTRDIAADADLLSRIRLNPARQLVAAQCSGTLLLAKLGLVGELPACTDLTTKPWVIEAGVNVVDAPFVAHGNVATAGGCMASQYLATWMIARGASIRDAKDALHYVAPVGEKERFIEQAMHVVSPFLPAEIARAA